MLHPSRIAQLPTLNPSDTASATIDPLPNQHLGIESQNRPHIIDLLSPNHDSGQTDSGIRRTSAGLAAGSRAAHRWGRPRPSAKFPEFSFGPPSRRPAAGTAYRGARRSALRRRAGNRPPVQTRRSDEPCSCAVLIDQPQTALSCPGPPHPSSSTYTALTSATAETGL
jgi:hypothetical protein